METKEDLFLYSRAIVSEIPSTLPKAALRMDQNSEPVNLEKANQQHQEYIEVGEIIILQRTIWLTIHACMHWLCNIRTEYMQCFGYTSITVHRYSCQSPPTYIGVSYTSLVNQPFLENIW